MGLSHRRNSAPHTSWNPTVQDERPQTGRGMKSGTPIKIFLWEQHQSPTFSSVMQQRVGTSGMCQPHRNALPAAGSLLGAASDGTPGTWERWEKGTSSSKQRYSPNLQDFWFHFPTSPRFTQTNSALHQFSRTHEYSERISDDSWMESEIRSHSEDFSFSS